MFIQDLLARGPARFVVAMSLTLLAACGETKEPEASAPPATIAPAQGAASTPAAPTGPSAPAGARAFFVEPQDGATLKGALVEGKVVVHVRMGVEGLTVHEAGEQQAGTGHHHIIVDGAGIDSGSVVPKDETHIHFGKGQTEADIPLTPGAHTLTMQFADGVHLSYGPQLTQTIKVNVEADPNALPQANAQPSPAK